jgi:hypothetical protein
MYFRKYFRKYTYNVVHVVVLPYFRTKVRVLSKEISLSYFRKYVYGSKLLSYFRTCTFESISVRTLYEGKLLLSYVYFESTFEIDFLPSYVYNVYSTCTALHVLYCTVHHYFRTIR